jgi:hypothetical protein
MLIITSFPFMLSRTEAYADSLGVLAGLRGSPAVDGNDSFTPTMWKSPWADRDDNGIEDGFDQEIAGRIANGKGQDYVGVVVGLKSAPTDRDIGAFVSAGGKVTAGPWTLAIYGFGGTIPYNRVDSFARGCSDVFLIEKDAVLQMCLAYAAQQSAPDRTCGTAWHFGETRTHQLRS